MKIRKGFVSNSSSSSFTCSICGNTESGYDASASELGFSECEIGHVFCTSHELPGPGRNLRSVFQHLKEYQYPDQWMNNGVPSSWIDEAYRVAKSVDSFEDLTKEQLEIIEEWMEAEDDLTSTSLCPICQLVHIRPSDSKRYLIKKHATNEKQLNDEIRAKFKDLPALNEYLREKG